MDLADAFLVRLEAMACDLDMMWPGRVLLGEIKIMLRAGIQCSLVRRNQNHAPCRDTNIENGGMEVVSPVKVKLARHVVHCSGHGI